ncbi:MAG TPA: serine protease [Candidatus Xenobia bacterium]
MVFLLAALSVSGVLLARPQSYPTYTPPSSSPSASASATTSNAPLSGVDLVKQVNPSVVKIMVYNVGGDLRDTGSGFFVGPNDVVTNCHVIAGGDHAEVKTRDGAILAVQGVVAANRERDVARLRVAAPPQPVPALPAAAILPEAGEHVVVIGSPLGLEDSVSDGIVSAIRDQAPFGQVVQMTAPVSPGNSGGPVVNAHGQFVGVVCFYRTGGQNLNFAIPAAAVIDLVPKTVQRLSEWNNGGTNSRHPAAEACQLWFTTLEAKRYSSAWNLMTDTTQKAYTRLVATQYKVAEDEARAILEGQNVAYDPYHVAGFWDWFRDYMKANQRCSGTFSLRSQDGDSAIVELTDPADPKPVPYLMFKVNGVWKLGLAETYDYVRAQH